ncbi:MAG: NAD(+) synthase [Clostridia bacterium]|nr:NAD(+) synthase [Clostridia bacterium]
MKTAQSASAYNVKIKLAAASPALVLGDVEANAESIISVVKRADKEGTHYLALPELCLVGATLGTLMRQPIVLDGAKRALERICRETKQVSTVFSVGLPYEINGCVRSSVAVVSRGRVHAIVPCDCSYMPFGFLPELDYCGDGDNTVIPMSKVAVRFGNEIFDECITPKVQNRFVVFMPSAVNATAKSLSCTQKMLSKYSARTGAAILYASPNSGESVTNAVFDSYCAIALNGEVVKESEPFSDDAFITYEADLSKLNAFEPYLEKEDDKATYLSRDEEECEKECIRILDLQANALKRRLLHIGSKGFIIGVSGGLDSTLALLAAVRAADLAGIQRKCVVGVSMPGFGTSKRTKGNADLLIEALGATYREINIEKACIQHFEDIGHSLDDYSVVYENTQARERTQVLLDIANKENLIDIATGDLSESALGWTTFNGDHMGQYGINASIPKTVMRKVVTVAKGLYKEAESVLDSILSTPVSPELLPLDEKGEIAQKTESVIGPYELHDLFLYRFLTYSETPEKLYEYALRETEFSEEEVYKTLGVFLKRFFTQQFKRNCAPECPNILFTIAPFYVTVPSDIKSNIWIKEYENIKRS